MDGGECCAITGKDWQQAQRQFDNRDPEQRTQPSKRRPRSSLDNNKHRPTAKGSKQDPESGKESTRLTATRQRLHQSRQQERQREGCMNKNNTRQEVESFWF